MALGDIVGGGLDIIGGNTATNIERRATRKAGKLVDQGYQGALDLARPQFDTSSGNFQRQSDRYNAGDFSSPDQQKYQASTYKAPDDFSFNPDDVFADPEYQAQMRAGQQAIEGGAASKGGLFSGRTSQDLTKFGSDLFAGRSDDLYKRARDQYTTDRDFGRSTYQDDRNFDYGAENRAYDTNADNRTTDFSMGQKLADYAPAATEDMINLGLGRAQAKADTELGVGGIRANNYRSAYGNAGAIANAAIPDTSASLGLGKKAAGFAKNYLAPGGNLY